MLNSADIEYIEKIHPELNLSNDNKTISGRIGFTAVYNEDINSFTINPNEQHEGIKFTNEFNIKIELNGFTSGFPKLIVLEDFPQKAERHFYTDADKLIACVCGVVEELEFMENFNIKDYIEQKVVPFLYGQLFFDKYEKWPWSDYSHNTLGVLESYSNSNNDRYVDEIIRRLKNQKDWAILEKILNSKEQPKGHTSCICIKKDYIRRCHPTAWNGLKKIYKDKNTR